MNMLALWRLVCFLTCMIGIWLAAIFYFQEDDVVAASLALGGAAAAFYGMFLGNGKKS